MFTRSSRFVIPSLLLTGTVLALAVPFAFAKPIPGLTPAQTRSLKALGIPVAVPSYVPTGFSADNLDLQPCPANANRNAKGVCGRKPNYTIVYRQANNTCFVVNGIADGVGGADMEYSYETNTPLLGAVSIGFGRTSSRTVPSDQPPTPAQLKKPQPGLSSFPAGSGPYYNVSVADGERLYGCAKNTSISPQEFEKVVKSLVWLK